jgi:hypothetical protein
VQLAKLFIAPMTRVPFFALWYGGTIALAPLPDGNSAQSFCAGKCRDERSKAFHRNSEFLSRQIN